MAYTAEEYTDMIITYGIAGENACLAKRLYAERYPKRHRYPTPTTIYNCVQRTRLTGNVMPNRSHAEVFPRDKYKEERILRAYEQNEGTSIRSVAKKLRTSSQTVKRVLEQHEMLSYNLDSEISSDEELEKPKRRVPSQRRKFLKIKKLNEERNNDYVKYLASKTSNGTEGIESRNIILGAINLQGSEENLTGLKAEDNKESESYVLQIDKEEFPIPDENQSTNIVLNPTTEVCNTLVDIPTHEIIEKRDENEQKCMGFEFVAIKNTKDSSMFLDEFKPEAVTSETAIIGAGSFYG